jgi:tRNA (guanine37-N1)-methyltransferase
MYHSYDIVGDIAIVKIPCELNDYETQIGKAFHEVHPKLKSVFRVIGETEEIERNRKLKLIWARRLPSEGNVQADLETLGRTVYREHGCRFAVDVRRVFFTPRLSYERMRIAEQVKPGEVVANMFGGVGTYAIIMAKVCPEVEKVYTIDVSQLAHELAKENTIINRCQGKVISILGDAQKVCLGQLRGVCDRVIMPLPEHASSFLNGAVAALKEGVECVVNYYTQISGKEVERKVDIAIQKTEAEMRDFGVKEFEADKWRIVREVGPRRYHVAIDLIVTVSQGASSLK